MRNDNFTHEGRTFSVDVTQDDCGETPWSWCDGNGPVSGWTTRDKHPGERVLCSDHGSKRYYDFAAAMKEARRDAWDAEPYGKGTKGEQALRAVNANFKYLKDWCEDRWFYASLHVVLLDDEGEDTEYGEHLGMVECDNSFDGYWMDAAREIASNILYTVAGDEAKERGIQSNVRTSIPVRNAMSEGARV